MLVQPSSDAQIALERSSPSLAGVRIVGTGICIPDNPVANSDLAAMGCDADWIVQRTGIQNRYHVLPGQATSDLALGAARACLENAGVAPSEIDLIIVATMTPDHYTPSASCLVQGALGCQCGSLDLNAACSGFLYSLVVAGQFVRTARYRNVLVIGAETMSMVVDPRDKKTFPLFGDGAAAAVVTCDSEAAADGGNTGPGILAYRLASVGEMGDKLVVPGGGSRMPVSQEVVDERLHYLRMDGRSVFKWAVRLIPEVVQAMLNESGLELDDIDLFIPHQANLRIIDAAVESLNLDRDRIIINLDRYGNTSAASVPICLHEALQAGRIKPGSHVLMVGFGAGLTWGSCLMRW